MKQRSATGATALECGFRDEGTVWKAARLFYYATGTGISYRPDAKHPNMYRVVYPNSAVSADSYNLSRVKQHCRDIAHAIYPRNISALAAE